MSVLAVLGPTGSGKSALAMQLARLRRSRGRPTEIVAVDAFTVYRGMDIGTAKPTVRERAEVPHHLVDVLAPGSELSVVAFRDRARGAIRDVLARGATPLLVGGSGLYWRAVVDDLDFPPTDPGVRSRLERRWADDPAGAHRRLADLDPVAARGIAPTNLRRTVRALEVIELTGRTFSGYDDAWERYTAVYPDLEVAYLEPAASELRERIRSRANAMVEAGLLEEARRLRACPISSTAERAIGYAEAFAVLDGRLPASELADEISRRTWRYAKRQRSWFRRDPRCTPTAAHTVLERWV